MGPRLRRNISSALIAGHLGLKHLGDEVDIVGVSSLESLSENHLAFSKVALDAEKGVNNVCVFSPEPTYLPKNWSLICSNNPRLEFAKALMFLQSEIGFKESIVQPIIGVGTQIHPTATIGLGVEIGSNCIVGCNVVIAPGVKIGNDCVIKSNSVLGEDGFGFERDENGVPIRMLHLGSVSIGNNVEVGSLNTICRGVFENTYIGDNVKLDDHVHIAHNCFVGENTIITACVELSGSVYIGSNCWIGPNSSFLQKTRIGSNSFVGIASNVTKDVPESTMVVGNPARRMISS